MKSKWVFGAIIIIVFGSFALYTFKSSLSPYVTIAEASATAGQVQVLGELSREDEVYVDLSSGILNFTLVDEEGSKVLVLYEGAKPDNFEHADSIVVIGTYIESRLMADQLLVKCPSKYESSEGN